VHHKLKQTGYKAKHDEHRRMRACDSKMLVRTLGFIHKLDIAGTEENYMKMSFIIYILHLVFRILHQGQ